MNVGFILLMCIVTGIAMIIGASLGVVLVIIGIVGIVFLMAAADV